MPDILAIVLIAVIVAIAFIVRHICIERRRRRIINEAWAKGEALREREGQHE